MTKLNMKVTESGSEASSPGSRMDIKKLQELYAETRDITKRLQSEREGRFANENKQGTHIIEEEYDELRETAKFLNHELGKAREQNTTLVEKYDQAQDEIHHCHDQIARQANLTHNQQREIEELKLQLFEVAKRPTDESVRSQLSNLQRLLERKEAECNELQKLLQEKPDFSPSSDMAQQQIKIKTEVYGKEMLAKNKEIIDLKTQLCEAQGKMEELYLKCQSEGAVLLENEHLKEDNKTLVSLLKGTKEYKNFAQYIEDSKGVIRVKPGKKPNITLTDWVPKEAYDLVKEFKIFHKLSLPDGLIDKLLTDLNKIWSEREERQIARIKKKTSIEIGNLRRQIAMRIPFDEIQTNKHISKLKAQLKAASAKRAPTQNKQNLPFGINIIEDALKAAGELQAKNLALQERVSELERLNRELQSVLRGEDFEKHKFMEGALWMAEKLRNEIEKYSSQIDELINEYNRRTQEKDITGEIDALFVSTTQAWLLESIDCACGHLRQKAINIYSSTQQHSEATIDKLKSVSEFASRPKPSFVGDIEDKIIESDLS